MTRLGRFFNLEHRRRQREAPSPAVSEEQSHRFAQVESRESLEAPSAPKDTYLRFGQTPSPLVRADAHEASFQRCMVCGADNNRGATRCHNCSADLETREQRAFHAAFWQQRKAERRAEAAGVAGVESQAADPAMAEARQGLPAPASRAGAAPPFAPSLLAARPGRLTLIALAVALFLLGLAVGRGHPSALRPPRLGAGAVPLEHTADLDGITLKVHHAHLLRRNCAESARRAAWSAPGERWDEPAPDLGTGQAWLSLDVDVHEREGIARDVYWKSLARLFPIVSPRDPPRDIVNGGFAARVELRRPGSPCPDISDTPVHLNANESKELNVDFKVGLADLPVKVVFSDGAEALYEPPY